MCRENYRDIEDSIDNIWSVLYSNGYLPQKGRLPGKQMKLAWEAPAGRR